MLFVCDVLGDKIDLICEVVYVDGICWVQIVDEYLNFIFCEMLVVFKEEMGFFLVFNMFFNFRGMLIVESVDEVLDCFFGFWIDRFFIENFEVFSLDFCKFILEDVGEIFKIREIDDDLGVLES